MQLFAYIPGTHGLGQTVSYTRTQALLGNGILIVSYGSERSLPICEVDVFSIRERGNTVIIVTIFNATVH